MKKFVFAAQVIIISAMLPVVAFLELNHGAIYSPESNPVTGAIVKMGKPGTVLHSKANENKVNDTATITLEIFLLKTF